MLLARAARWQEYSCLYKVVLAVVALFGVPRCRRHVWSVSLAVLRPLRYGWLQVKCRRCETYGSIPLEHIDRPGTHR
jgi:hypothetical protein